MQLTKKWWWRLGITTGLTLAVGVGGGMVYGWFWLRNQLVPLVEDNLTKMVDRPLKLGELESFGLTGLSLGKTILPATEQDSDQAVVERVDVGYNPILLLTRRELRLSVTLVRPQVRVEQDKDRVWVATTIHPLPEENNLITIILDQIKVKDGNVTLVPRSLTGQLQPPIATKIGQTVVDIGNNYQRFDFRVKGNLVSSGDFQLAGDAILPSMTVNLGVKTKNVNAQDVVSLLGIPLSVTTGQITGNLNLQYIPDKLPVWQGKMKLNQVTAGLPGLVEPIRGIRGDLVFQKSQVVLKNGKGTLGKIGAIAHGVIDLETGYNLTAEAQQVKVADVIDTFKLPATPVPVIGEVKAQVAVTGILDNPLITVTAQAPKPILVDKLELADFRTEFAIFDNALTVRYFRGKPVIGGTFSGEGKIQFPVIAQNQNQKTQNSQLLPKNSKNAGSADFNIKVAQVPARKLVEAYKMPISLALGAANAQFRVFSPLDKVEDLKVTGAVNIPLGEGTIKAENLVISKGLWQTRVNVTNVAFDQTVDRAIASGLPPYLNQGKVAGLLNISGKIDNFNLDQILAQGQGVLKLQNGQIIAQQISLQQGNFKGDVIAKNLNLKQLLPQMPLKSLIPVNGNIRLYGNLSKWETEGLNGNLNGQLQVAGGTLHIAQASLTNKLWQTQLKLTGIRLEQLTAELPSQLKTPLNGQFQFKGDVDNLDLAKIEGQGNAHIAIARGTITANQLRLVNGIWQGQINAHQIQLAQIKPELNKFGSLLASADLKASGSVDNLDLAKIEGQGQGKVVVAGGIVTAQQVNLHQGRLAANITSQDVQLATFSSLLRGNLTSKLQINSEITNWSPKKLQASADLVLSQGVAVIDNPLTAKLHWDGTQLKLLQGEAQDFSARGFVNLNTDSWQKLNINDIIQDFYLNIQAKSLDLAQLSALGYQQLASNNPTLPITGSADFDGTIVGTIDAPQVDAKLALNQLQVSQITFEPLLQGYIKLTPQKSLNLALVGTNDQISVNLANNYQPLDFALQWQQTAIRGQHQQQQQWQLGIENLSLQLVKKLVEDTKIAVPDTFAKTQIGGELSSNITLNLGNQAAYGNLRINNPIFNNIRPIKQKDHSQTDFIATQFQYLDNNLIIDDAQWQRGYSLYSLHGRIKPTLKSFQIVADAEVKQGDIQDLLVMLQFFDYNDLGRGLNPPKYAKPEQLYQSQPDNQETALFHVGLPKQTILEQLRRLSEVEVYLRQRQEQRQAASPFPELRDLQGTYNGNLSLNGSLETGFNLKFAAQGGKIATENVQISNNNLISLQKPWKWGRYPIEQVQIKGLYQDGILTIQPVLVKLEQGQLAFVGSIAANNQLSGQIRVNDIPVALIEEFVKFPIAIGLGGTVNSITTLGGSLDNPQARGEMTVLNASVNQTPIIATEGSFSYNNARCDFFVNSLLVENSEPLTVIGSIPYQLPFAQVKPVNNDLNLKVDIKNQSLKILNVISLGQLEWIDGQGDVQLLVSGTFDQQNPKNNYIEANGIANIANAIIKTQIVPDAPLTEVNGKINFNLDNLQVETLSGNFSGGKFSVVGNLPLLIPREQTNPLQVSLDQLALRLKGLYEGGVDGDITITGSLVEPHIGGKVNVYQGKLFLSAETELTTPQMEEDSLVIAFNNLNLELGQNMQITLPPILNFLAEGQLNVNGTLAQPRPDGIIQLTRGQVNLFATQFRLDRHYDHIAQFIPEKGLDPYLNLRLRTNVTESPRSQVPVNELSSEIRDVTASPFNNLQSVQIEAMVDSFASKLTENIELSSVPKRSETEIIALLGGSFVDTFGQVGKPLGLANLASSALFNRVENNINNLLGFAEMRFFQTSIGSEKEQRSAFGILAELSVDLGRDVSVSVQKSLTGDDPFRYNLLYRLNGNTVLRGSTDLQDDSRFFVEYELKF